MASSLFFYGFIANDVNKDFAVEDDDYDGGDGDDGPGVRARLPGSGIRAWLTSFTGPGWSDCVIF